MGDKWIPKSVEEHEKFVGALGTDKGQDAANAHNDATAHKRTRDKKPDKKKQ